MSTITIPFRGGHFSPFLPIHQNLLLLVHFFIISVLFLTFSKRLASVPQLMFLHVKSRWMLRPYVCYVPADLFVEVFPLCAWWFSNVSSFGGDFNPRLLENHGGHMESDFLQRRLCSVHFWRRGWPEMPSWPLCCPRWPPLWGHCLLCPAQLSDSPFLGNSDYSLSPKKEKIKFSLGGVS